MISIRNAVCATSIALSIASTGAFGDTKNLDIKFAGALEFTGDGTLFIGDNYNGAIYAFKMPAEPTSEPVVSRSIGDIDREIANLLGVNTSAVEINDMATHPDSNEIYISLSRIGNFSSQPAIVKVGLDGDVELLDLTGFTFDKQTLKQFPEQETTFQPRGLAGPALPRDVSKGQVSLSSLAIMDIEYHDGELFVAGVASDNFLSSLRRITYPFDGTQGVTTVDMYHVAHDQYETRAPIRAMTIQEIDGKTQLVAAYTCSPIVLIPLDEIVDGAKITANTIIDMGNGQPIDMIPFKLGDQDMLFVTNNSRSPQVVPLSGLNGATVAKPEDFERGPKLDLHPVLPYGPAGEMVMFEGSSLQMDIVGGSHFASLTRDAYSGSLNLDVNFTWFPNRIHNLVGEFDFPQWRADNPDFVE